MWIHLVPLGLIDGASSSAPPAPDMLLVGGWFHRWRQRLAEEPTTEEVQEFVETTARQVVDEQIPEAESQQAIQEELDRVGIAEKAVYMELYRQAYAELVAQKAAQAAIAKAMQDEEDEQIARIIAALI
jgi:hypothetical protein